MVSNQVDTLKQQYTDKYVMVDAEQPELARFRDVVGRVKTVNMSGRALVEFGDYLDNIGWYDIDLNFLKIVDKPPPKAEKPEAKKPAAAKAAPAKAPAADGGKKLSPLEMARMQGAAKKGDGEAASAAVEKPAAKPTGGKMSTADILAAARAGKSAAPAKTPAETPPAEKASGESQAAAKPAPVDRSKMSTADILAAARAGQAAPAESKAEAAPAAEEVVQEQAAAAEPAAEEAPAQEAPPKSTEKVDKSTMSTADIIAWCREHDSK